MKIVNHILSFVCLIGCMSLFYSLRRLLNEGGIPIAEITNVSIKSIPWIALLCVAVVIAAAIKKWERIEVFIGLVAIGVMMLFAHCVILQFGMYYFSCHTR